MSGTNMTFANEMAQVLDDGDNLRVMPIVTYGAASNLDDLLYLRQIDVAVTQSDVFEYFKTQRKIANLDYRVHYILRLPISEMHLIAGNEIPEQFEEFRAARRSISARPAARRASPEPIVFQRFGVKSSRRSTTIRWRCRRRVR